MKKNFIVPLILLFFVLNNAFSQSVSITPTGDEILITKYSTGTPNLAGRQSSGTSVAPTATASGLGLATFAGRGHSGTSFTGNRASIDMNADQLFTATAQGTRITFNTTLNGTTSNLERMRIDNTGKVGIGSTDPLGKLQINHDTDANDDFPHIRVRQLDDSNFGRLRFENSNGTRYFSNKIDLSSATASVNSYRWTYGTTELMRMKGDGKFGIGTTNPAARLHISHDGSDTDPHLNISSSGTDGQSRINWTTVENVNLWTAQSDLDGATSADNYWRLEYNGATNIFNVKGNGNVGIGTSTQDVKLSVVGTQDNNGTLGTFKVSNGANDMIFDSNEIDVSGNSELFLNNNGTGNVNLATGGGKVGIGTGNPTAKLDIEGDIVVKKTTNTATGTINALSRSGGSSLFMNGAGTVTVNGIAGGVDGMILYLICGNSTTLVLNHENVSAAAGDRITTQTAGTITITQRGGAVLIYESSSAKWRIIGFAN